MCVRDPRFKGDVHLINKAINREIFKIIETNHLAPLTSSDVTNNLRITRWRYPVYGPMHCGALNQIFVAHVVHLYSQHLCIFVLQIAHPFDVKPFKICQKMSHYITHTSHVCTNTTSVSHSPLQGLLSVTLVLCCCLRSDSVIVGHVNRTCYTFTYLLTCQQNCKLQTKHQRVMMMMMMTCVCVCTVAAPSQSGFGNSSMRRLANRQSSKTVGHSGSTRRVSMRMRPLR